MKKLGFYLVPILMILLITQVVPRLFAGGTAPSTMVIALVAMFGVMFLCRPKKTVSKSGGELSAEFLTGYAEGAFDEDEALAAKFYAAMNDWAGSMPKSASAKLDKLQPLCTTKKQQYAVGMASAKCYFSQQKYKDAIREFNRCIVLEPSAEISIQIGDCHQRLGNLNKARDAYEYAMELDPKNVKAPSILATTYVADWDYDTALIYAADALELDNSCSQALATTAICYGMKGDEDLKQHYTRLAVNQGYSEEKINTTISTLKKRSKA